MLARALLIAVAAAVFAAAPAAASTAAIDDGDLVVAAAAGEANDITLEVGGLGVVVSDTAGIQAVPVPAQDEFDGGARFPARCERITANQVSCLTGDAVVVNAGDGDDRVTDGGLPQSMRLTVTGGAGNDELRARAAPAALYGDDLVPAATDGGDLVAGGTGSDRLHGGGGNDRVEGRAGADEAAGDGGSDVVEGGPGDDVLDASALAAADGTPLPGDAGNDRLRGGDGDDRIVAAAGGDDVDAGAGDDDVRTRLPDGRQDAAVDTIRCGAGIDRLPPGPRDRVAASCERLVRYPCAKTTCRVELRLLTARRPAAVLATRSGTVRPGRSLALALAGPPRRALDVRFEVRAFTGSRRHHERGTRTVAFRLTR